MRADSVKVLFFAAPQAKDAGGSGAEQLPRNVSEEHVREIFAHYGVVTSCQLAMDERVQLSKGYAGKQVAAAIGAAISS